MQSFAHDASWQLISGLSATVAQSKADFFVPLQFSIFDGGGCSGGARDCQTCRLSVYLCKLYFAAPKR